MRFFSFREYIRNVINEQLEIRSIIKPVIDDIEAHFIDYKEIKIGKTSNIDGRFDTYYRDAGYVKLIPIKKCESKRIMDELEKELIDHFGKRVNNDQLGGGNKSYSQDYWIYIVVK